MASFLWTLANNLSEGIQKTNCKHERDYKKCETCGITFKVSNCFLEYTNFKDDFIEYKCLCCNKNYQQVWWKVKEQFLNAYKFSNYDNNKFILLLQKDVYPYEYMDETLYWY